MKECTMYLLEYNPNGVFKQTLLFIKLLSKTNLDAIINDYELDTKIHDNVLVNEYQSINGVDTAHQLVIN